MFLVLIMFGCWVEGKLTIQLSMIGKIVVQLLIVKLEMIVKIKLKYKTPVVYLEMAFFFIARNHYHYHYYIIIFIIFSFYLFLSSFLLLLYFLNFFFLRKSFFSSFLTFIPILNVFSGLFSLLKLSQKTTTTTTTALFCLNVLQYIVPGTLNITQVLLATAVLRWWRHCTATLKIRPWFLRRKDEALSLV